MLAKLFVAMLAASASAFSPAAAGSVITQSRVAPQATFAMQPVAPVARTAEVAMNADGEHETLYEMCARAALETIRAAHLPKPSLFCGSFVSLWIFLLLPAAPVAGSTRSTSSLRSCRGWRSSSPTLSKQSLEAGERGENK